MFLIGCSWLLFKSVYVSVFVGGQAKSEYVADTEECIRVSLWWEPPFDLRGGRPGTPSGLITLGRQDSFVPRGVRFSRVIHFFGARMYACAGDAGTMCACSEVRVIPTVCRTCAPVFETDWARDEMPLGCSAARIDPS